MAQGHGHAPLRSPIERHAFRTPPRRLQGRQARRLAICISLGLILLLAYLFSSTWGTISRLPYIQSCHDRRDGYQCRPDVSHNWGQYSPYFSVPSEISPNLPRGCDFTFAQTLSRHGSRDPTLGRSIAYAELMQRLQREVTSFKGDYVFLRDFEYSLGADQLTAFGEGEMFRSGRDFYRRYRALAKDLVPFVRASGQQRVIASARNFTQGLRHAATKDEADSAQSYPLAITVLSEAPGSNNTLSDGLCDAFETGPEASVGHAASREWALVFGPAIVDRLNADLPGADLDIYDGINLMDMCAFHTVASPVGAVSRFCDLFTKQEWKDYGYYQTLSKYYGHGPGNPLGSTQGVGFVNELIARLTGKAVKDHTSVNHTLDSDPRTFPIGGSNVLFADFSHDNDITSVLAALGLYNSTEHPSNTSWTDPAMIGGYSTAWTVPFAARVYVEKMKCSGNEDEFVRVLVNGRVMQLDNCHSDVLGRCSLNDFVNGLKFAREGGHFDQCFNTTGLASSI